MRYIITNMAAVLADAVIGVTLFGESDPIEFGIFDRAFVTLFQITCGATWVANLPVRIIVFISFRNSCNCLPLRFLPLHFLEIVCPPERLESSGCDGKWQGQRQADSIYCDIRHSNQLGYSSG